VQLPHAPPTHTPPEPQAVPFATALPVSWQADTPVEQLVKPVWHVLVGVHATPAVHALHAPLSQTSLVPQLVPFAASLPVSLQTETPVEQLVEPAWQLLSVGVQATPDVHA
jgi:hypothetical protein